MAFLVYAATCAPEVGCGHDTGELTTAAATLGVAHPPGYPLYVQLGHLWTRLLPWGNPAWKLNLFSAFCGALACAALAAALGRATGRALPAWVAGLCLAFSTAAWRQAVVAEVFALQLAFLGLLLYLAVRWRDAPERTRVTDLAALTIGLGMAHHHTLVLAVPGLLLYGALAAEGRPWGFRWTVWPLFVLGCAPWYGEMMLRARQHPSLNWGDPSDWERLKAHFLRKAYGTLQLSAAQGAPGSGQAHMQGYLFTLVRNQFPAPTCVLPPLGLAMFSRFRALSALLLAWALTYGPLFCWLGQQETDDFHLDLQERFYASSVLALAGLAGLAALWLLERWPRASRLLWLLPFFACWVNAPKCSQAGQYQAFDTGMALLAGCPPKTLLVVGGDLPSGVVDYLQIVEGQRPDVQAVYPGLIGSGWFGQRLPDFLRQAVQRAAPGHNAALEAVVRVYEKRGLPVYFNHPPPDLPGQWRERGLAWRWYPVEESVGVDELALQKETLRQLLAQPLRGEQRLRGSQPFWMRYMLAQWLTAYRDLARTFYREHQPQEALEALQRAVDMGADRALDHINLGLLYADRGDLARAESCYRQALEVRPGDRVAVAAMVDLFTQRGDLEEARRWRAQLSTAPATAATSPDPDSEPPASSAGAAGGDPPPATPPGASPRSP